MFKEKSGHILLFCSIVTICTAVLQYLNEKQDQYNVRVNRKILERVYAAPAADQQQ